MAPPSRTPLGKSTDRSATKGAAKAESSARAGALSSDSAPPAPLGSDAPPPAEPAARARPPTPSPQVNRAALEASNRELRAREAEEDRELITQAQSGDKAAFRALVERHQRRAFVIAVGLVRDENDAREIVQEAFLRVYKGLANFEGTSSFFTWLYRIVTNLAIDLMRKPGRKAKELDEARSGLEESSGEFALVSRIDGADPIDVMRRKEMAARIKIALDALPSYHRAVIVMREVDGMSYEEMAEAMDVSKGTIMSRLFHARQKMQRALGDVYAELGATQAKPGRRRAGDDSEPSEDKP